MKQTNFQRSLRKFLVPTLVVIALGAVIMVATRKSPPEVDLATYSTDKASSVLVVSGILEPIEEAVISSPLPTTRIAKVFVDKGAEVRAGDPLIQLDTADLVAARDRAQAAVGVAEANLTKAVAAEAGAGQSLNLAASATTEVVELRAARDAARAQVDVSENRLKQVRASTRRTRDGARAEEIRQAEANVRTASVNLDLRTKEAERTKKLVDEGALARSTLDTAVAVQKTAENALEIAREQLLAAKKPRTEDLAIAVGAEAEAVAALNAAKIASENAQSAFVSRLGQLSTKTLAETTLNTARADVTVAQASLTQARVELVRASADLEKATLRAPIAGSVIEATSKLGESATPGQTLMRLTTTGVFRVRANIEEKYLPYIAPGQTVQISVESAPDLRLTATVDQILDATDSTTGTVQVLLKLQSKDQRLRSGMTLDINIETAPDQDVNLVPASAVVREGDLTYVFFVLSDKATKTPVKLGRKTDKGFILDSGLKATDSFILDAAKVSDGMVVKAKARK
ncbi:MAG: efflux RND transporter periplasmic adaptor subunit [Fimbriimonas sp.]